MNTDLTYHTELPTIFPNADQYIKDICACCRSEVGYGEAVASPGENGYLVLHRSCAVAHVRADGSFTFIPTRSQT